LNHFPPNTLKILLLLLGLGACAPMTEHGSANHLPMDVSIIAFNDFHGHLEPPLVSIRETIGKDIKEVPAGGAAYMAAAINHLKKNNPLHAVVSAGDMIGASPLTSALFLDEPTIEVVNAIGIDFNAVGNHEFDKGTAELLRMRHGGCEKYTRLEPCQVNAKFAGANFEFLAANVRQANQKVLFPPYGVKTFKLGQKQVKIGFVGLTLKATPKMVTPDGIKGLSFDDEASSANALVPELKAQGVSAIVLVIHEGGVIQGNHNDSSCPGLSGDIVPIINRLDPAYDVVVSGHTHRAYACEYSRINPSKPFLLTSAGQYGTMLTHIQLKIDPKLNKVLDKSAFNLVVQSESFVNSGGHKIQPTDALPFFGKDPVIDKIVTEYKSAAQVHVNKVIGHLPESFVRKFSTSGESQLGNFIADAQWFASSSNETGGAHIALMNPGGVRADLPVPLGGGSVNFGQIFKVQPFGNTLVVKRMTGQQIKDVLEFQFENSVRPKVLFPSATLSYEVNLLKEKGQRIGNIKISNQPVAMSQQYRVTVNSFIASGGDGFWQFKQAETLLEGGLDVDALAMYIKAHPGIKAPELNRIRIL
jgi:5'-nucleotidase